MPAPTHSANNRRTPRPAIWNLRPQDEDHAATLARTMNVHPAVGRLLAARGWNDDAVTTDYLSPKLAMLQDPFELRDMDTATARILAAVRASERIAVFGDYDVDGISSTAVMVLVLRHLGADPAIFIPHRVNDGYGMNADRITELAATGVTLIITVDTGVTAIDEIEHARSLGVDVVITDHHRAEKQLPNAVAIVNPNRTDAWYDGARLCGVGVAFKVAHGLLKAAGCPPEASRSFLRSLLDLVALGTIADVVPLLGENRVLAHFGLQCLTQTERPGLRALIEISRINAGDALTPHHVAFMLAPRLNAAGRTQHASTALELLLTNDPAEGRNIAQTLERLNRQRREEELLILDIAIAQAEAQMQTDDDCILVVAGETFHLGVVGIVAARLVERFNRPAIVMRIDEHVAKGSARSIPGFDIHATIGACEELLLAFGGHAAAAGVQVAPDRLDDFRRAVNEAARHTLADGEPVHEVTVDTTLAVEDVTWPLIEDLDRLQPFGEQNPAPLFLLRGLTPVGAPRIVGTDHLRMNVRAAGGASLAAIGFNLGALLPICENERLPIDLVARPMANSWRGRSSLELEVRDLRPAD